MDDAPHRGAPSNVRGRLSEVYLPALVSAQAEQLVTRLGDRATIDDPMFGRAAGMPGIARLLDEVSAWLTKRDGAFDRVAFTTGSDRDVTEGTLSLTIGEKRVSVPVAVVAERRPEREVEIRLYYATVGLDRMRVARAMLVPRDDNLAVPPPVAAYLHALASGDVDAIVSSFEEGATLSDPAGAKHRKHGFGGPLREYHERLLASQRAGRPGIELLKGARADDGNKCALEYAVADFGGRDVPPHPGLSVYERGESGLLCAARLYHDY